MAIHLHNEVWQAGEARALDGLMNRHYANYRTGLDSQGKVKAYASLYLYARIAEQALGPGTGHGRIAAREIQYLQQSLDEATSELRDHEIAEGIDLAMEMLNANSNCCFRM